MTPVRLESAASRSRVKHSTTERIKTRILLMISSLMKVESIGAFYYTFDLHYAIIGLETQFSVFLRVAALTMFFFVKPV